MSRWIERHLKWVFTAPALVFILLMMAFPILYTAWISLTEWSMSAVTPAKFVGLQNYINMFGHDTRFWHAVWRTFYFTGLALVGETILGLILAAMLNRDFRKARRWSGLDTGWCTEERTSPGRPR